MTFEHFVRILLKRWGLVVICCVLIGLGAFIGSKLMKPLYQSTVVMEVVIRSGGDPLTNDNILASQQLAQTETNLATTASVFGEVALRNPGLSVDDLAKEVTATPKANTQLFEINILDPDPTRAAVLANSIAAVLIQQQARVAQQNPAQASFLVVAQSARPASSPARPNTLFNTGAGLLTGLMLGILLALMFELLDTRVRTDEDLTELLDWPVLAELWKTGPDEHVVNFVGYNSNTGSYGTLLTNIEFAMADKSLHTLVVTSGTPGEGKSVIAANLAIHMAKTGKSTMLIDANLRHPTLHEQFGIPASAKGFSNALLAFRTFPPDTAASREVPTSMPDTGSSNASGVSGRLSLAPYVRMGGIPNLQVMSSGPLPPNPLELLDSKAIQCFFRALSNHTIEVVIFDAPSLLGLADAAILASKVDGTLVVVNTASARRKDLKQVKALLGRARARVLGCVVNKQRRRPKNIPYKNISYSYDYGTREHNKKDDGSMKDTAILAVSHVTPATLRQEQNEQNNGAKHDTNNIASPAVRDINDQTIQIPVDDIRSGKQINGGSGKRGI